MKSPEIGEEGNLCLRGCRRPRRWRPGASSHQSRAAVLVTCHAATSALIPAACHISISGEQLRRSTRCVGRAQGANFLRSAHRQRSRSVALARVFFFLNAPSLPLSRLTQPRGGLQEIKRYAHQQPHPLHFRAVAPSRLAPPRAASRVLPAAVSSRRCLAARPGFKVKKREEKKEETRL